VPNKELITKSITALSRICADSELRKLWNEGGELAAWLRSSKALLVNLEAAVDAEPVIRAPRARAAPRVLCKMVERFAEEPSDALRDKISQKITGLTEVNTSSSETGGIAPLALVSQCGLLSEARALLERGALPDGIAGELSPFELACREGHIAVATLLHGAGAQVFHEVTRAPEKMTLDQYRVLGIEAKEIGYRYCRALFYVASGGNPPAADYLLSLGADIHQTDLNGENLLHKACQAGNLAMIEYLLKSGLHVDSRKGSNAESVMHFAARSGDLRVVEYLLDQGANPNLVDKFEGRWFSTPLDLVDKREQAKLHALLRKRGALAGAEIKKQQRAL
jgi:hypothetical protein